MTRGFRGAVAASGVLIVALASAGSSTAQTPPERPAPGELGGPGPCTEGPSKSGFGRKTEYIWVRTPAGGGHPRTGGTCDDANRPVVFISPGYGARTPDKYPHLISDMISNGHIVVYVNYSLLPIRPDVNYEQVQDGFEVASTAFNDQLGSRMDLDNIGIWGHSLGAGMVPWLAKQADARGLGRESMWLSSHATSWVFWVELSGAIEIPDHARVQVVAYDQDDKTDHRIGIDLFEAYSLPESEKDHIQIRSDGEFLAHHSTPTRDTNYFDWYAVNRNYQALSDCALTGTNCDTDLSYMGEWSDGRKAVRAIVSDDPVDMGPPDALVECGEDNKQGTRSRCGPP